VLFHLAEPDAWADAQMSPEGVYRAASLRTEGFVHCSWPHQLDATARRYYRGREDLVLLRIDARHPGVAPHLVVEATRGPEAFPHVYSAIPLEAVVAAAVTAIPS
jgi:uncharacterized protein (DUF952 family)